MKRCVMILICALLACNCEAQIYQTAIHLFEKMSWGQSLDESQKVLGQAKLKEDVHDESGPFASVGKDVRSYTFEDTLVGRKARVTLSYDIKTLRLSFIIVAFLWLDAKSGEKEVPFVWNGLRNYYGNPFAEKSVPFVGASSTWNYPSTQVKALKFTGQVYAIMLHISPAEK